MAAGIVNSEYVTVSTKRFERFKAGVHLNAVFSPLNMGLIEISRARFVQYKNCLLILLLYV